MGADIYIFDPMRCLHATQENDSIIEQLLASMRQVFRDATMIISHHMRKRGGDSSKDVALKDDMRRWSDEARGSGAIKAHSDVIVCQERIIDTQQDKEIIYWGAFGKDIADIEPISLEESDVESFYWQVTADIPPLLQAPVDHLKQAGGEFPDKSSVAKVLIQAGIKKATAYRYIQQMKNKGFLMEQDGKWTLRVSVPENGE